MTTQDRAETLRALHRGPDVLRLPNVWDAGSARVFESLGAPAIATSSAGVAWANGYADGHHMPLDVAVAAVAAIVRVVRAPVTADCESGYADAPAAVGEAIRRMAGAGAVGVNLEDGATAPDAHCRKIEAARRAADAEGVALFINARTDVWLARLGYEGAAAVEEGVRRATLYLGAGADGIFTPGVTDIDVIRTLAARIDAPLNVLAWKGLPPLDALRAAGVRRLSAGAWTTRVALNAAADAARRFLEDGAAEDLVRAAGPPVDYNALFR